MTAAAVTNNDDATPKRVGGVTGKGFKPGQSGNPKGRPKGVAAQTREFLNDDPTELLQVLLEIAKSKSAKDSDRKAAAAELLDRGWGKAPSFAPVEDGDPLELSDADRAIGTIMDELAAAREAKAVGPFANGTLAAAGEAGAARA